MNDKVDNKLNSFVSLRRKLMIAILFASSLITMVTTAFQYYIEYKRDINYITQTLNHISSSNSNSLTRSLWNLDDLQIQVQLDSILKLRDFVGVAIYDEDGKVYYKNTKSGFDKVEKFQSDFPLMLSEENSTHYLGKLVIWATNVHINENLISRLTHFFFGQLIKTMMVIFVMLYLFRIFITKHLDYIMKFLKDVDLNSEKIQKLHLRKNSRSIDELDYVKDSINNMLGRVEKANIETNEKIQRQEREIKLQKAASINSARLASLGEMAANIAHEINNPLTVLSFSGKKILFLLSEESLNIERLKYFSGMINRTVERMTKTITSLKRLSRDTKDEDFQIVTIHSMLEGVLDLCQMSLSEKGIKVTTEFIGLDYNTQVRCQEVKITQVIINLLNNACDEIKEMNTPWIKIIVAKDDHKVSISVVDCGLGIPENVQERMFEPFFTTKEIGKGTGLGLSISASTAIEHKGRLFVDNSKTNTTVTLEFSTEL